MHKRRNMLKFVGAGLVLSAGLAFPALSQAADMPGVTDTEIKLGNIAPYSGPASAYSTIAKTISAYFDKVNEEGGINGRKINFLSYDDGYSPPKAVEQARKLVESDEALLIFQSLGTPSNSAIEKYMNMKKVPQLLVATGATKFGNPEEAPWTMGWQPNYQSEGIIYGRWITSRNARCQDRRDVSERRFRQGCAERSENRPWRQGGHDRRRSFIRGCRAGGGFAGRQPEGLRRQCVHQYRDAEVRRPGDQEGPRDRLGCDPDRRQRLELGGRRSDPRRA
jgi:hypothetical protein